MRKIIHIEVGSELDEMLKKQAKKEYMTVSFLVRNVLREYVGDPENETVWSRQQKKKKLTILEKEIQGVGITDKKSEPTPTGEDDEFNQALKENL